MVYGKTGSGKKEWRFSAWPAPRPLYGLDRVAARPDATIIVTEGEKAADAAEVLFPDCVAVTSPGGSAVADMADCSCLKGRHVVIAPDQDEPGRKYADEVYRQAKTAGAVRISLLDFPYNHRGNPSHLLPELRLSSVPKGADLADMLAEGWTAEKLAGFVGKKGLDSLFIDYPEPGKKQPKEESEGSEGSSEKQTQAQKLLEIAQTFELFHAPDGQTYASFDRAGHRETWPVRSKGIRGHLIQQYFIEMQKPLGGQAVSDALGVLEAQALFDGPECEVHIRTGQHGEKVYLDLCDPDWSIIEVCRDGWKVASNCPVKFRRARGMKALPNPVHGGSIDELRHFLNVPGDEAWILLIAWIAGTFNPTGPKPILIFSGEQGSCKSTQSRIVKELVDPSSSELRTQPRDERDLSIAGHNGFVLGFDNLSGLPHWLSDAFCRLATGAGFATRELYSDRDEVIFEAVRPVVLNGIDDITNRMDLLDRSIIIHLPSMPEERRRPESELLVAFREAQPRILGALLDVVVTALSNISDTKLPSLPRMADFALWVVAAEPALPWPEGRFMEAYTNNRSMAIETSLESDYIASAVRRLMEDRFSWEGTASELLEFLEQEVDEKITKLKSWPKAPNALSNRLRRSATFLRQAGIEIENGHKTTGGKRLFRIIRDFTATIATIATIAPCKENQSVVSGDPSGDLFPTLIKNYDEDDYDEF